MYSLRIWASYVQTQLQQQWSWDTTAESQEALRIMRPIVARNTLKHDNKIDYDNHWSKMNKRGQKFMELNPQSVFNLEKDEANRLVILCIGSKF